MVVKDGSLIYSMTSQITLLAISGSLRIGSSNTAILKALQPLLPEGVHIDIYEGIGQLPHFNPELDKEGAVAPASVHEFRERLKAIQGLVICTPEYAHGVPGMLKNALDWVVGSGELVNKPVALISASPSVDGGDKALASLTGTIRVMNATLPDTSILSVPLVSSQLTANGPVPALQTQLQALVQSLLHSIVNA